MKSALIVTFAAIAAHGTPTITAANATTNQSTADYPAAVQKVMNPKADPCVDFYDYACGSWVQTAKIPADEGSISYTSGISVKVDTILREVAEAKTPIVSDLYQSCMNMTARNAAGVKPLQPSLNRIQTAKTSAELMTIAGELATKGFDFLDVLTATPDGWAMTLPAEPLSLPIPYYDPSKFPALEPALRMYVSKLVELAGGAEAAGKQAADAVVEFETSAAPVFASAQQNRKSRTAGIAKAVGDRSNVGDDNDTTNSTVSQASTLYPLLAGAYLKGISNADSSLPLKPTTNLTFPTTTAFGLLEQIASVMTVEDMRSYLTYRWLDSNALLLSESFQNASFALKSTAVRQITQQSPQWKQCVQLVGNMVPKLMGKYYFDKVNGSTTEAAATKVVDAIEAAMKVNIQNSSWLDATTRANALTKLSKVTNMIGRPKTFESFSFPITKSNWVGTAHNISAVTVKEGWNKVGKPINKTEWAMAAFTVNAYYDPPTNEIVFPIAIMQSPFFDVSCSAAQNYGAIGGVVGHELTHGFDDQGRLYDGDGQPTMWWTDATDKEFTARSACLIEQYSKYTVKSSNGTILGNVDGNLTLGENIADNGGVKLAYNAYRTVVKGDSKQTVNDKLFFVSYAQSWCSKTVDAQALEQLVSDTHAPDYWRVNGVLQNNPVFARTFQCAANAPMNPAKKCEVW